MKPAIGILVVNRMSMFRTALKNGVIHPQASVGLSPEHAFRSYRGFNAEAWPEIGGAMPELEGGLAPGTDVETIKEYMRGAGGSSELEVLLLATLDPGQAPRSKQSWSWMGIDVGYFEAEYSQYSLILNEVIFGKYPRLRRFSSHLNRNLLFDELNPALELISEHREAEQRGDDVEHCESIEGIAIYLRTEALD